MFQVCSRSFIACFLRTVVDFINAFLEASLFCWPLFKKPNNWEASGQLPRRRFRSHSRAVDRSSCISSTLPWKSDQCCITFLDCFFISWTAVTATGFSFIFQSACTILVSFIHSFSWHWKGLQSRRRRPNEKNHWLTSGLLWLKRGMQSVFLLPTVAYLELLQTGFFFFLH